VLAPVLARLQAVPGVASARVDSSGRFFWISFQDGADAASGTALALGVLGSGARLLGATEAEAQRAAHGRGDPWLGPDEVMGLSYVEARLLSVRIAGEAERRLATSPAQRESLAEAIRLELFAAMERVHAEGGRGSSGWIYVEWPALAAAAVSRCREALDDDLRRGLGELLPGLLAR
jgi:hypothetical protein